MTVADYLRTVWLPGLTMDHSPTTCALYNTISESYLIPNNGGITIEDLTSADLTKLYAGLLDHGGRPHPDGSPRGLAPKTVRSAHTTIRRALQDAVEEQPPRLAWNAAASAKAPKVKNTRDPAHWTAAQVRTFLEHIAEDRLAALWITAANTGLRRGELVGLRWQDIDLNREQLTVRQTRVAYGKQTWTKEPKTLRSRRTIPIPAIVVVALERHAEIQAMEKSFAASAYADQGYVFADEIGDPLAPAWVSSTFVRRVKQAGLPRISLHGLRHSFATVALEAGVDVLYVSELLGHSTPTITMNVYQHVRRERLEGAVNTISEAIHG
jgi:integrase